MNVRALTIEGFRGIRRAHLSFGPHTVLVGPNSVGKTTVIDALSLVFGRTQLVRDLTEHDFFGSCPKADSRIRIIATLGGFKDDDPDKHSDWFRDGRAVPKWWNPSTGKADPERSAAATELCAQIAFAARFDLEELTVEPVRYFYDADDGHDPFDEEAVELVPARLMHEIGFYVLPIRRTWEATVSFASDLFRKAVATFGGIPAETLLEERDRLRSPARPLEDETRIAPLVTRINGQLSQLMPDAPQLKLRVTSTDSEALLRALVPHYVGAGGVSLPIGRHGTGLLSLQIFILLLEIGRARRKEGLSFILAMEEPELHVPPGLQRRLLAQAISIAGQTICSSHSPRIGAFYPSTSVQFVDRRDGELRSRALLPAPLPPTATQAARMLFQNERTRAIEALMHHRVLIPEGRGDCEWLRLLCDVAETGDAAFGVPPADCAPFGAVVGVVPTQDGAVGETFRLLSPLRGGFMALVDGDTAGNQKVAELVGLTTPPETVLQWQEGWEIEDVVAWIVAADEATAMPVLKTRLTNHSFSTLAELLALLKQKSGQGRLKTDYLAYEEIARVIQEVGACRARAVELLDALTRAARGDSSGPHLETDAARSTAACAVVRFRP